LKDIRVSVVIRDKKTNETEADVAITTWRDDVPLKEIMGHIIDAIERIEI